MTEYCVVGSGPAGVACAHALLTAGGRVRMLDAGITLEPSRRPAVERLSRTSPEHWTRSDLAAYQAGMNPDVGGVPLKLVFGSDFAYREASESLRVSYDDVGLRPSFALGGLTSVWGAAMMPYEASDMADWPFGSNALAGHYAAVLDFVGLAAQPDNLAERFPLFTKNLTQLELSNQSHHLLTTMEQNREALQHGGIIFGRSRLAVRGNRQGASEGCVYCRLCMYGCPYDLIYTSAHTVAQLQRNAQFTYESGVVVTAAREVGGGVAISGHRMGTSEPLSWKAKRVFLAAGAVPTTQILLRSLGAYNQVVTLKDSQYFLVPLLARRIHGASTERSFGLGQLFVEIFDSPERARPAHVQIYSNSDLINSAVANAFGPLRGPLNFLIRNFQERLLVAQGFLHSDYSSRITVRLRRGESDGAETLELRGETNPDASEVVRSVMRKLSRYARQTGARPLTPMLNIAKPGRSFHNGGSFPMRENPRSFETDVLGRVPGWSRIHAVDSTVFPSIPATTITLSAMANAHRIGSAASQLDNGS